MTLPVTTAVSVPFPAGVASATLTGALLGVSLASNVGQAPDAVLTINVATDDSPGDYVPLMVFTAGSGYPRPLVLPIGQGYCPLPADCQNLPADIQLQVQNAGATVSVNLVTSA